MNSKLHITSMLQMHLRYPQAWNMARMVARLDSVPAAPRRCPVAPFVEETASLFFLLVSDPMEDSRCQRASHKCVAILDFKL